VISLSKLHAIQEQTILNDTAAAKVIPNLAKWGYMYVRKPWNNCTSLPTTPPGRASGLVAKVSGNGLAIKLGIEDQHFEVCSVFDSGFERVVRL